METNEIICLVTCSFLLLMNFIFCCIDTNKVKKLEKRINALEGKQK